MAGKMHITVAERKFLDDFARRLRDWRKELGLTEREIAAKFGATKDSVRKYEEGVSIPSFVIVLRLKNAGLNVFGSSDKGAETGDAT